MQKNEIRQERGSSRFERIKETPLAFTAFEVRKGGHLPIQIYPCAGLPKWHFVVLPYRLGCAALHDDRAGIQWRSNCQGFENLWCAATLLVVPAMLG